MRPSGYESIQAGGQAVSPRGIPSESLDSLSGHSVPAMQSESGPHKNFGQPVVRASATFDEADEHPLTPAQAARRFDVPEYLLRKACAEGTLQHLRVVNSLWLAPAAVEQFARSWRATKRRRS